MNVSSITIRDLEYLTAVARHLHFGKAAAACHVTQPALSAQIRKLEDQLGFQIFERTNRKVALTERGQKVITQAHIVLEEAQKLIAISQAEGIKELEGTLRIGAIASVGPYYIPFVLPLLKKKYPKLQVLVQEGLTEDLLADLKDGNLDLVIAARTFDESGLQVFPLFDEPFLLAVPKEHPLSKKEPLKTTDLVGKEMVLLEDGHCLRDQALQICPPNRRGNIRQFHAMSLETLRQLVAAGMGYTLMPKLAVPDKDTMKGLLKYRPFKNDSIGRTIVLVCRERFARLAETQTLADLLRVNPPL
jgi:LysR family transcriptional regulator, hydrogen peroxide-inducible genes activator